MRSDGCGRVRLAMAVWLLVWFLVCAPGAAAEPVASFEPKPGKVIILASADMLKTEFLKHGADFQPNVTFFHNLVETFTLDDRLLKIRRRRQEEEIVSVAVSPSMAEIMEGLKEDVSVRYYSSEPLPRSMGNLKGLTRELFKNLGELSGGKFRWEEIDPVELSRRDATEKVKEYYAAKDKGQNPMEPCRGESLEDLFLGKGKPKKTDAEILDERKKKAETIAREAKDGRSAGDEFRRLLTEEFAAIFLSDLQLRGIQAMTIPERGLFRTVEREFFSAIEIRYLAKEPEVIPQHFWMGDLEFELARRILKLAQASKPTVVWFDGRKPSPPPQDPSNPLARPPLSDYSGIVEALGELFDIVEISLKENDSVGDVLKRIHREPRKEGDGGPPRATDISCLVVSQPHDLEKRQVYEISRAVSNGIPTIFLVSNFSIDISEEGRKHGFPILLHRHGLDELFGIWGIKVEKEILASRECASLPVLREHPLLGAVRAPVRMPVCVKGDGAAINDAHHFTARVPWLTFPAAIGLTVVAADVAKAGLSVIELANSGKESYAVGIPAPAQEEVGGGQGPTVMKIKELFDRGERVGNFLQPRPLALLLEGKFASPFQGLPVPAWEPAKK